MACRKLYVTSLPVALEGNKGTDRMQAAVRLREGVGIARQLLRAWLVRMRMRTVSY
jgi:hypothetical protein